MTPASADGMADLIGEAAAPARALKPKSRPARRYATGILPAQAIRALIREHVIQAVDPIGEDQIQPASLDLRLGSVAYRVRASFLPGSGVKVIDRVAEFGMHEIDLRPGAALERDCVYVVPLLESLSLRKRLSAMANPKSSTGRLDIFTRLIADGATEFDLIREGYKGPLFAEISPRTFSVVVRTGTRLNQIRFRKGHPRSSDAAIRRLMEDVPLVEAATALADIRHGLGVTVDLRGAGPDSLIGYRAKPHTGLIDLARIGAYDPREFWEPIRAEADGRLILNPGDFYILVSRESVCVPPDQAAEMKPYDTLIGEFRVHYAGFFDPGFGWAEQGAGSRAVLEVRSHDVPFLLEHGQIVARLIYERLTEPPERLYGEGIGSSYQRQGLQLAKQFKKA